MLDGMRTLSRTEPGGIQLEVWVTPGSLVVKEGKSPVVQGQATGRMVIVEHE